MSILDYFSAEPAIHNDTDDVESEADHEEDEATDLETGRLS